MRKVINLQREKYIYTEMTLLVYSRDQITDKKDPQYAKKSGKENRMLLKEYL